MTVWFVGAGPGDPGLLTLRGAEIISRAPVVLYAGSLVPREVVARARPGARVLDTASMTLDEIVDEMRAAHALGHDVARVHTGDPSLFGALAEQTRRLDALGIEYEVVPGVSSFTAAAAAVKRELTLPGVAQAVILARIEGRTGVPEGQRLAELACHRTTLALFLSAGLLDEAARELAPAYGPDCPAVLVHRASWPDQRVIRGTLADVAARAREAAIDATAMVLVGPALGDAPFEDSRLYDATFEHGFRETRATTRAKSRGERNQTANGPGLLLVYTGDGKGKTTAALGLALRALGRGLRVAVVQFVKGRWKTGERSFAEGATGLDLFVMGEGFTWQGDDPARHAEAARRAWIRAAEILRNGDHAVVVLDEITYPLSYGWLDAAEVLRVVASRPAGVHVVATGRDAPAALVDGADLVTEMRKVKHPYDRGVRAQPGVDF